MYDFREYLESIAKAGTIINYKPLADKFHLHTNYGAPVGTVLGVLSYRTLADDGVLLSAIVVRKNGPKTSICPLGYPSSDFFNFKCIPQKLLDSVPEDGPLPLSHQLYVASEQRKVWRHYRGSLAPPHGRPHRRSGTHPTFGTPRALSTDEYLVKTRAGARRISRLHNGLSNDFQKWISMQVGVAIAVETDRKDLQCTVNDKLYLLELKVTQSADLVRSRDTKYALREALGQLLDYSQYPGEVLCYDHLGIGLDTEPSQDDVQWLTSLKDLGLDVEIYWRDGQTIRSAGITRSGLSRLARRT